MDEKKHQHTTTTLTWVIAGLLAFSILMLVFSMGIYVGQQKALFSFQWAENYHQNFGGPQKGLLKSSEGQDFMSGHGVVGFVMAKNGNMLIVKNQDAIEETIIVLETTTLRNNRGTIALGGINIGDQVVVIGSPNTNGQIEATFIRVLPKASSLPLYYRIKNS